ncbi:hypothetical protein CJJ09_004903 [Candidozyma auris]|nr:hypothetical protein CJJ09_004903 [[Candida] auris]
MFGKYINDTEDPQKYKLWKPKIEAYRARLHAGIKDEFKLPDYLLPTPEELEHGIDARALAAKALTGEEMDITSSSATQLARKIAKGELTAVEVFKAFAKTATVAHQLTNCAMELFVEEGLQRASELDAYYAETGKTVGPLHGLPISLKEHYAFKGKVVHAGYVGKLDYVSDKNSAIVQALYDQGAVFYVRTTEPQMLMHVHQQQHHWQVQKPCNTALSPGGSSSGEGVLAAMNGSAFGIGSDIGGSIRAPAAFCAQNLKIAICYDDGVVKPTPPILRALKVAKAKLEAAGVEVVEWKSKDVEKLVYTCYVAYNYDHNYGQKKRLALSGEPVVHLSQKNFSFGKGDEQLTGLDVQRLISIRDEYRCIYMDLMNEMGIDYILSPTYVAPASKPETITYWGYTCLWNILDFPNVVFPTGLRVQSEDQIDKSFVPRNELEQYEYTLYSGPEDFINAPICLQLTGRRYTDENVVKAAKVLSSIMTAEQNTSERAML